MQAPVSPSPAPPATRDEPSSAPTRDRSSAEPHGPVLGLRRRFLVERPSQLRTAAIVTGVTFVLLVLVNVSLHTSRVYATRAIGAESPQLRAILEAQNHFELVLGIAASAVLLLGAFIVTILETHRTAGASYRLSRELDQVRHGTYGVTVRLRRGDNLRNIERAFNSMTRALAERAVLDVEELEHAASVADRIASPPDAHELASALREMADERRRSVEANG